MPFVVVVIVVVRCSLFVGGDSKDKSKLTVCCFVFVSSFWKVDLMCIVREFYMLESV